MRWKPLLAVLIGLLMIGVTARIGIAGDSYLQQRDTPKETISLGIIHTISPEQAEKLLKEGQLILVDSHGLEVLKDAKLLPYIIRFGNDTVYAVKILPGGRFFIYAAPEESVENDIKKFKEEALTEFRKAYFVEYTVPIEIPVDYSWRTMANGKVISNFSAESVSTSTDAYLESKITWTSGDEWYPRGRLQLIYLVYKLADMNPDYDWRVVDMQTYVYAGRYLWGSKQNSNRVQKIQPNSASILPIRNWEFEKITIQVDTRPDGNSVFSLDSFKPSYNNVDYYNEEHSQTLQYTLGNGGASVTITNILKAVKITVDNIGENWVRWTYKFNRDLGVGDEWVNVEPGYMFSLRIPNKHVEASQKFTITVNWVDNIPLSPDIHASNTLVYYWDWSIN
ncbi:hypothetical protein [Thermococcus piezophilus]|uniref:Uncharacterized protein n=1 Tax=Thermococcus piezophilus TaxID=1712654 RepID=A0A172WIJ1_9EURY|nr:hypothetical protein [Thermococcus piezophilus]ANF23169.1 hypothetical protein A7C91_08310 [Thermococcus piezophilus]